MRYLVRLSVPRAGGWRAWGTTRGEFGRQLAGQESAAIALHVTARSAAAATISGRHRGQVDTDDAAEALDLTWWAFRKAAGEDLAGWALADAEAEVRPARRWLPRGCCAVISAAMTRHGMVMPGRAR